MINKTTKVTPGKAQITTTHKKNGELLDETATELDVEGPIGYQDPTCTVGLVLSHTKNLGNFESVRVEVRLDMPAYPEEIDPIFDHIKKWCDSKLTDVISDINESLTP